MFSCDVGGWLGYGIILSQFVKSKVVFGFDEDESRPLFGQTSGFGSRSFHDVWGTMKKPASAKASAAGRSKWCVPCSLFLCLWKSFCVFSREIESQSSQSHFAQRHWRFYGVKEPSSTVAQVPDFPCVDRTLERSIQTVQRTTRHHTPLTPHLTKPVAALCCSLKKNWQMFPVSETAHRTSEDDCRMLPFWRGWQHCCNVGLSAALGFTGPPKRPHFAEGFHRPKCSWQKEMPAIRWSLALEEFCRSSDDWSANVASLAWSALGWWQENSAKIKILKHELQGGIIVLSGYDSQETYHEIDSRIKKK